MDNFPITSVKFDNRFLVIMIGVIALYATLLLVSDFNKLANKIANFNAEYLPVIISLIMIGWIPLFVRWNLLLKHSGLKVPLKKNLLIYLSGFALSITPGKIGELLRAQILKSQFDLPRTKTTTLVLVEKFYDLAGAILISLTSIWFFHESSPIIIIGCIMLGITFALASSKTFFSKALKLFSQFKFLSKFLQPLSDSFDTVNSSTRGKIAILSILLSMSYWLITTYAVYFILVSFKITQLNYLNVVSVYPSSLILGAISFIPGGIGVAEGSLAAMLSLQGIELSTVFVLVIFIRVFTLWYGVVIGFISLKLSGTLSSKN
jgi:uncharacterized protein (TIRG00374 family)